MAAYDKTGAGGVNRPSRRNPGVRTPYLVENAIDIPAETLIMEAGMEVITALSSSATIDLGITGGDVDIYCDGDANATGYSVLTATARHVAAAADTLDMLIAGADSSAGKVRVWAVLCDVSGIDETDRN